MLIIPVEKRFDWKHTPIVLFALVLLNIFVYFNVQAEDDANIESVFLQYQQKEYLALEWPFLNIYLKETNQLATLDKLTHQFNQKHTNQVISYILFNTDFYRYLRQDQYEYFQTHPVGDWFLVRRNINTTIQTTTLVSHGLVPSDIKVLSLLSYQFLHGSLSHLLGNLLFLILFGFAVEASIGHLRFLAFYIISGVCGGLLYALLNDKSAMPLVGASGSISGAMAMYLGIFRFKKIKFFYWFYVIVGYFKAPAIVVLLFYIGKEVYQLLSVPESNVAYLAHIGGFLAGAICIAVAYFIKRDIFNDEYIEQDQSISKRQQQKAEIYNLLEKYQFSAAETALADIVNGEVSDTSTSAKKGATPHHKKDQLDFELSLVRYNIEKIDKNKHFENHLIELLTIDQVSADNLIKLEDIWQKNAALLEDLDMEILIKIAENLAKAKPPTQASHLFEKLYNTAMEMKTKQHYGQLAILAKKIADAYGLDKNEEQQQRFSAVKRSLLSREFN